MGFLGQTFLYDAGRVLAMLVVEPVRDPDVDPVARLAFRALSEQYDPDWLAEHARSRRGAFLVARDVPSNRVVGFALADQRECEGHLLALAVDAQRRGEGIGTALLKNVRDHLASQGAFRLSLEVRADDPKAQVFYTRHGFYPEGLESHVYSDGADAVKMSRPL
jgi:[ribosomal protein S18]-alanine N-acetyltransferase